MVGAEGRSGAERHGNLLIVMAGLDPAISIRDAVLS
jgi:hypothetical protein